MSGTTAALLASQVVMAAAGVLAARALGPEGRGVVAAVLTWPMVLGWLSLIGLNSSATVRIASARSPRAALAATLGNAVAHSCVFGGVVAVCAIAFVPGALAHLGPNASTLAVWTLATIPTIVLADMLMSINVALGRIALANWCRLIGPVIVLAGTVLLILLDAVSPQSIVALTLGSGIVALVVAASGFPWRTIALSMSELRADLRFGFKAQIGGLVGLANQRLDLLLMSALVSSAQVGYYGVATNMMMPVLALAGAVAILLTPRIAGMGQGDGDGEVGENQLASIRRDQGRCVLVALAVGAGLAVTAPLVVPGLFGQAFEPAVLLMWVMIPGYVARAYAGVTSAGTLGLRRPWVGNLTEGAGFVVTIVLLPILLPRYDAMGAAITSTAAYFVAAVVAFLAMRRLARDARADRLRHARALPSESTGRAPTFA